MLYATPVFFLSLLLIIVFAQLLPVFPAQAAQGDSLGALLAQPGALVLPVLAGGAAAVASFSRYIRAATLDNLTEDYVRAARARGTREREILWRHVWPNSLTRPTGDLVTRSSTAPIAARAFPLSNDCLTTGRTRR